MGQWEWLLQCYESDSVVHGMANKFFNLYQILLEDNSAARWLKLQHCLRNLYHVDAEKRESNALALWEQIGEIGLSIDALEYTGTD